ncbi:MAG: N-acetyl-gamma-glutamyl-phosphate reductase [Deltaproteobacteria bacterium]|nr:N-acetyl-gamma-glutamyl-phosphate reductase [Deltaproteobacteria bacterium]MCB9788409.1 N-acetyl-gamma-glutamyl-phosphate reductase [Deltaproteobacteria bacterium]
MTRDTPIRVGICGITAYTGQEAARLVAGHPDMHVVTASSDGMAGRRLSALDRDLGEQGDAMVVGHGDAVAAARDLDCELMFIATTPELAVRLVPSFREAGVRVVDLSGAHRLSDPAVHMSAYGLDNRSDACSAEAVYGLSEWAGPELSTAGLVANPGGFPTAILLALLPLCHGGLVDLGSVVVDGKFGTTGAGRSARIPLLYSELFGNFYMDLVGPNRHIPEIDQALRTHGHAAPGITFVAHLLPVPRGIYATIYLRVPGESDARVAAERVASTLATHYEGAPFVQVLERPEEVHLDHVVGTNRCRMAATSDPHGGRVVVVSALDNLVKGGAGQAVQNANRMFGLDESAGLALRSFGRP